MRRKVITDNENRKIERVKPEPKPEPVKFTGKNTFVANNTANQEVTSKPTYFPKALSGYKPDVLLDHIVHTSQLPTGSVIQMGATTEWLLLVKKMPYDNLMLTYTSPWENWTAQVKIGSAVEIKTGKYKTEEYHFL